jgi:methionyl-tRNA formyltransferase
MRISLLCNDRIALPALDYLIENRLLTAVGMPDRKNEIQAAVSQRCRNAGIGLRLFPKREFNKHIVSWLTTHSPDIVLVMTFPFKIPPEALLLPRHGFVNFHYAPLPACRGSNPLFWMIRNKVTTGGVTVHRMNEEYDAGPIVLERSLPLGDNINFGIFYTQLAYLGLQLMIDLLKDPVSVLLQQKEQVHEKSNWYGHPKPDDLMIDWHAMEAEEISSLVKACNPWNKGAGTKWNGWTFGITYASVARLHENATAQPGTVLSIDPSNGFVIACKNGKAIIAEVVYCEEGFYPGYCLSAFGLKQHERLS